MGGFLDEGACAADDVFEGAGEGGDFEAEIEEAGAGDFGGFGPFGDVEAGGDIGGQVAGV